MRVATPSHVELRISARGEKKRVLDLHLCERKNRTSLENVDLDRSDFDVYSAVEVASLIRLLYI